MAGIKQTESSASDNDPTAETCFSPQAADLIMLLAEQHTAYADVCLFSKEELAWRNIKYLIRHSATSKGFR